MSSESSFNVNSGCSTTIWPLTSRTTVVEMARGTVTQAETLRESTTDLRAKMAAALERIVGRWRRARDSEV